MHAPLFSRGPLSSEVEIPRDAKWLRCASLAVEVSLVLQSAIIWVRSGYPFGGLAQVAWVNIAASSQAAPRRRASSLRSFVYASLSA